MANKLFALAKSSVVTNTDATVYKNSSNKELYNNTGKTPIRVDKEMAQVSCHHSATVPMIVGIVVHMTDETGSSFDASITNGVTDLAALELLLNQWKDNIFMTDFQFVGTGSDENIIFVSNLEADTRRILQPGQKLLLTVLAVPCATEAKSLAYAIDNILWTSPAAQ